MMAPEDFMKLLKGAAQPGDEFRMETGRPAGQQGDAYRRAKDCGPQGYVEDDGADLQHRQAFNAAIRRRGH